MFPIFRRRFFGGYPVGRPLRRRFRMARFFRRIGVLAIAFVAMLLVLNPTMASAKGIGEGRVVKKDDVTAALNCFSLSVYGRTYDYTDTGAIAGSVKASIYLPPNDLGLLNLKVKEAGVAAYGTIQNGLEIVLAGEKGLAANDTAAVIRAGGLSEIALGGYSAPSDQAQAQALIADVAPALADLPWTVKTTENGNYIFYASGYRTFSTGHGPVTVKVGALATVLTGLEGNTVVSVLVGTGGQAHLVR